MVLYTLWRKNRLAAETRPQAIVESSLKILIKGAVLGVNKGDVITEINARYLFFFISPGGFFRKVIRGGARAVLNITYPPRRRGRRLPGMPVGEHLRTAFDTRLWELLSGPAFFSDKFWVIGRGMRAGMSFEDCGGFFDGSNRFVEITFFFLRKKGGIRKNEERDRSITKLALWRARGLAYPVTMSVNEPARFCIVETQLRARPCAKENREPPSCPRGCFSRKDTTASSNREFLPREETRHLQHSLSRLCFLRRKWRWSLLKIISGSKNCLHTGTSNVEVSWKNFKT